MAALKAAFEAMGYRKVRTVLASGNVVFEAPRPRADLGRPIALGLETALGFPVKVLTRTAREIRSLVLSKPFKSQSSGSAVQQYVTFLGEKGRTRPGAPLPDPPKGTCLVKVGRREIFSEVLLSQGGQTSDLMNYLDRNFGPTGTTRNWRTVLKLAGQGE